MKDDDVPPRAVNFPKSMLALREEQRGFQSNMSLERAGPIDPELVGHAQAAVARLSILVTAAVRASDDAAVRRLDRMLRQAEALLMLAQGAGRR